jgi:hypothetical protein
MVGVAWLRSGSAANAPKDRVHSITAAVAILLFFMMVILLFTEDCRAKSASLSLVNSIDPDHILSDSIFSYLCQISAYLSGKMNYEEIMELFSFYKKKKRPKIIMPLVANLKQSGRFPGLKYYILYPEIASCGDRYDSAPMTAAQSSRSGCRRPSQGKMRIDGDVQRAFRVQRGVLGAEHRHPCVNLALSVICQAQVPEA